MLFCGASWTGPSSAPIIGHKCLAQREINSGSRANQNDHHEEGNEEGPGLRKMGIVSPKKAFRNIAISRAGILAETFRCYRGEFIEF